jgi:hypothetical protein
MEWEDIPIFVFQGVMQRQREAGQGTRASSHDAVHRCQDALKDATQNLGAAQMACRESSKEMAVLITGVQHLCGIVQLRRPSVVLPEVSEDNVLEVLAQLEVFVAAVAQEMA